VGHATNALNVSNRARSRGDYVRSAESSVWSPARGRLVIGSRVEADIAPDEAAGHGSAEQGTVLPVLERDPGIPDESRTRTRTSARSLRS
jgi:hypothetical protein